MKILLAFAVLLFTGAQCEMPQSDSSRTGFDASPKLYEGDNLLTSEGDNLLTSEADNLLTSEAERNLAVNSNRSSERLAVLQYHRIWPKKEIPYILDTKFGPFDKKYIKIWLEEFSKLTCLKVVERTNQKDYVKIVSGTSCSSKVGRLGGEQTLTLEPSRLIVSKDRRSSLLKPGCINRRIVLHEIMHTAGFWHEHQRFDRHKYVDILEDNIKTDNHGDFELKKNWEARDLGEYDINSIMHYHLEAHSKNGKQTIQRKDGKPFTPKAELSQGDISGLKELYRCDIPEPTPGCVNKEREAACHIMEHNLKICSKEPSTDMPFDRYLGQCLAYCGKCHLQPKPTTPKPTTPKPTTPKPTTPKPTTPKPTTPKPTTPKPECKDTYPFCEYFDKLQNVCGWPLWIPTCQRTCGKCD